MSKCLHRVIYVQFCDDDDDDVNVMTARWWWLQGKRRRKRKKADRREERRIYSVGIPEKEGSKREEKGEMNLLWLGQKSERQDHHQHHLTSSSSSRMQRLLVAEWWKGWKWWWCWCECVRNSQHFIVQSVSLLWSEEMPLFFRTWFAHTTATTIKNGAKIYKCA